MKKPLFATSFLVYCFLLGSALAAQEDTEQAGRTQKTIEAVASNIWEELYYRIEDSLLASSVLELLKMMELEPDQASLASSYVVILKSQIRSYPFRYEESPAIRAEIIGFLLDKIGELAETVTQENSETANFIALFLIPDLNYGALMGKADHTLGLLGAENFSPNIIKRLENINAIMTMGNGNVPELNYSASGSIAALAEFQSAAAFPILFQIRYGSFSRAVRKQAAILMEQLEKNFPAEVKEHLTGLVSHSPNLSYLKIIVDNIGDFNFDPKTIGDINLALLTHLNESRWLATREGGIENKSAILRKTIEHLLENNAENRAEETFWQLERSYSDSADMNVKLLALEAIGKLSSEKGLQFLREEIVSRNIQQRSSAISVTDERILRQLVYALSLSGDSSEATRVTLRDISITPYSFGTRKVALDVLEDLSQR